MDGGRILKQIDTVIVRSPQGVIERPMRFPTLLVNRLVCTLIKLSPFVQKVRKKTKLWSGQ